MSAPIAAWQVVLEWPDGEREIAATRRTKARAIEFGQGLRDHPEIPDWLKIIVRPKSA